MGDPARTHIQLCGNLVVEVDGARCERALPGRQGRMLFAYLVVNRMRSVSRDELIEAVWSESTPAAPDAGLSALLSKLRRLLGPRAVHGLEVVRLSLPADAFVDLEAAVEAIHRSESALTRGDADAAYGPSQVAMHFAGRGFLPGDHAPWIDDERPRLDKCCCEPSNAQLNGDCSLARRGSRVPSARRAGSCGSRRSAKAGTCV